MKHHEAARKLVKANIALGNIREMADERLKSRISEAQGMITEVCDGIYPDIIDEVRRECIDATA